MIRERTARPLTIRNRGRGEGGETQARSWFFAASSLEAFTRSLKRAAL
jgi:hypothetical protein